mmetsp:Transcript_7939/g.18583  ORF Transcript_7939/g.18583 Transcript_7939/m.18583 type:complete len:360 (-) Transcript_7939:186-1265(-)
MGYDRSRSPKGNSANSQWISRQLAQFGRYAEKRPWGLQPNDQGAFLLSDIIAQWGEKNGLSEQDVLEAVQQNMYHHGQDGAQRFVVDSDEYGNVTIMVNPRRGWQNPRTSGHDSGEQKKWWGKEEEKEEKNEWWKKEEKQEKKDWWVKEEPKEEWKKETKWKSDDSSWPKKEENGWKKEAWNKNQDDWKADKSWESGQASSSSSWDWKSAEKVQRYIGWLLKSGAKENGLRPQQGYLPMADVARVMQENEPNMGISTEEELQRCLEETDAAGRFEIKEGWVKKVHRDGRVARDTSAAASTTAGRYVKEEMTDGMAAPNPPPGPGWTKYQDNGSIWYYYEGAQGKWWCQDGEEPQPFQEE